MIDASLNEPTDGLRFVRSFKFDTIADAVLRDAQDRHRETWFVIRPLEGDDQFAVLATRQIWFLGSTKRVSLSDVILAASIRRSFSV